MANHSITTQLMTNPWLASLPKEARNQLIAVAKIKSYQGNQLVHSKDSNADGLYGLLSGEVRISSTTLSGEEIVFTRIIPGQWFGEIAILDGGVRTHDGFTTKKSKLAIIPKESLLAICKQNSETYMALVSLLCDHCRQAFAAVDDFLLFTPEQRIAKRLLDRYSQFRQNEISISQQELGALIGVSRQSTNKILKSWEAKGWIKRYYRGLEILQLDRFREMTEYK